MLTLTSMRLQIDLAGKSEVTIHLRTTFGQTIQNGALKINSSDGQPVFSKFVKEGDRIELPYGGYSATFISPYAHAVKTFNISTPKALLLLAGSWMADDVPPVKSRVRIKVKPAHCLKRGLVFVRLTGIFSDASVDQGVSEDDWADFGDIAGGRYVAMVVSGEEVRAFKAFKTIGPQTTALLTVASCDSQTR